MISLILYTNYSFFWILENFYFQGLSYDLGDCTKWEYMFPSIDKPLKIPGEDGFEDFEDEEVVNIN